MKEMQYVKFSYNYWLPIIDTLIWVYEKEIILSNSIVKRLEENIEKFRIEFSDFLIKNEDFHHLILISVIKNDLKNYEQEKSKFYKQ